MITSLTRNTLTSFAAASVFAVTTFVSWSTPSLVSPAEAASCGALNQKPCPIWKGRKSCDKGLVEDFAKGRCVKPKPIPRPVIPAPPKNCGKEGQKPCPVWTGRKSCDGNLVEDFVKGICRQHNAGIIDMAKQQITQSGELIGRTALAMGRCQAAKTIIDSDLARGEIATQLQKMECVQEMILAAKQSGYKSMSIGLGAGVSVGIGGDVEAGFIFDTSYKRAPAFYTIHAVSAGWQIGLGGALVVSYNRSDNAPGSSIGHGATAQAAALGGTGAATWFEYDGTASGLSVFGIAGAEFSAAYLRHKTIIRAIPGAKPIKPITTPNPIPSPGATVQGKYYFVSNPSRENIYKMPNNMQLLVAGISNGRQGKWHSYTRINTTTFRATTGAAHTYQVQKNGDLLWTSGRADKKRIVLRKR